MEECPKCRKWTSYYNPRNETQTCSNCGYEKHVKYEDYIRQMRARNEIRDLLYPFKRKQFFNFSSPSGQQTGESILFLEELVEKIKKINIKTIEYHFYRRDFEKWIIDVYKDEELAKAMRCLHDKNIKGETFRKELYNIVVSHLSKSAKPLALHAQ